MTTYGPYEPYRKANGLVFVSGQVGINPTSGQAQVDIVSQTKQALVNLESVLAELTDYKIVKITLYLTNVDDFSAVNEVYKDYFEGPRPARSCVGVADLPHIGSVPLCIEIDAIAARKDTTHG